MRISVLFITLLIAGLAGCDKALMNRKITEGEYSVKGLLDSLHTRVADSNPLLFKYAVVNGKKDSAKMSLDSSGWNREFQIFNDLKISAGRLAGRYEKVVAEDSLIRIRYIGKDPKNLQLDSFYITTNQENKPVELRAFVNYSNSLNTTRQRLQMKLQKLNNTYLPTRYKTEGWNKMKMKDTVHFVIESRLEY